MPKSAAHKKEEDFDEEETEVKTKATKKSKSKKPRGPSSAYNIYVAEHRAAISAENPGLSFGDLSKRVSADWKQLSEEQRKVRGQKAWVAHTHKHTRFPLRLAARFAHSVLYSSRIKEDIFMIQAEVYFIVRTRELNSCAKPHNRLVFIDPD